MSLFLLIEGTTNFTGPRPAGRGNSSAADQEAAWVEPLPACCVGLVGPIPVSGNAELLM